jgi:hypothetical protein
MGSAAGRRFARHSHYVMSIELKGRVTMAALAVVAAIATTRACVAQSAEAHATVTLPAVVVVRSVSTISTRRIGERLIEVTQRVMTSANTSFAMTVVKSADGGGATSERSRAFVRDVNGAFVPLESGTRVLVAKGGVRGAESSTGVVFRIEASGVETAVALPRVVYEAVADAR